MVVLEVFPGLVARLDFLIGNRVDVDVFVALRWARTRAGHNAAALLLFLIHPSAWNRYSRKFISSIMHSPSP